jgi:hypothetical protein
MHALTLSDPPLSDVTLLTLAQVPLGRYEQHNKCSRNGVSAILAAPYFGEEGIDNMDS